MTVKLRGIKTVHISGEYIKLDALLKFAAVAASGGEAKCMIGEGNVFVGGTRCTLRGKKIRPGDIVRYENEILLVR